MPERSNVISAFFETARVRGTAPCAHFKRDGRWRQMSWTEMADAVRRLAAVLAKQGVGRGDRVVICSASCLEWTIADCAIMAAGGITVPIYPSLTADRIARIIRDSEPSLAFAGDEIAGKRLDEAMALINRTFPVIHSKDIGAVIAKSAGGDSAKIDQIVSGLSSSDIATIVYTSGTMGEQKGVVLTHGNVIAEVGAAQKVFDFGPHEIGLVCLPLAHVLGRLMQFYQLLKGCQAAYAEGIEHLAKNYIEVRPHFVCGVPRMLEKVFELVHRRADASSRFAKRIFGWALAAGLDRSNLIQRHRRIPLTLMARFAMADLLVFRRIRAGMGGRLGRFISGGAPLKEEVARFFHAAGILVLEGYGLTETFAAATANRPDDYRFGTVGKPLPGVELKLAPDGEALVRGPTVFREYRNMPEETREAFDPDGWFRTGDLGEFSRDGFLRITGRKKDMIVTAGGKNVAPQMIEALMSASPHIDHFMVYGDGRKYLTALVAINEEACADHLKRQGSAPARGLPLARHAAIRSLIEAHIEEQNKKLAQYETIKRFAIVDGQFSIETGELTPTLKVRRGFTSQKYRDILEELYKD